MPNTSIKIFIFLILATITNNSYAFNDSTQQAQSLDRVLENNPITNLEYLVAEGHMQSLESIFGHSALRFITTDSQTGVEYDMVLSFQGDTGKTEGLNKLVGAVSGEFPVITNFVNFEEYLELNVVRIGRSFTRIPLPLNQEIESKLRSEIIQLLNNTKSLGNFYYTSKNCMTLTMQLLKDIGYYINTAALKALNTTPMTSTYQAFLPALLMPYTALTIEGSQQRLERIQKQLGIDLLKSNNCKKSNKTRYQIRKGITTKCQKEHKLIHLPWSKQTIKKISTLESSDLWSLFYTLNPATGRQNRLAIIKAIKAKSSSFNSDLYFNNKPLPESASKLCRNLECAKQFVDTLIKLGVIKDLNKTYINYLNEYNRAKNMIYSRQLLNTPQAIHARFLLNAMFFKLNINTRREYDVY